MRTYIEAEINKTRSVINQILNDEALLQIIEDVAKTCSTALRAGNKILFAGNGGSAADSQHLAAELVSRLCYNRPGLAAIALTTDTSALTAIGNDYSFENLFARQIEAIGRQGDIFIAISTSGKSKNILKALEIAHHRGLINVGMSGKTSPEMSSLCKLTLNVPSSETPKIQEGHIMIVHIFCALVEEDIFGAQYNPQRQTLAVE